MLSSKIGRDKREKTWNEKREEKRWFEDEKTGVKHPGKMKHDGFKQKNWSQKCNKGGNIGSYKRNKLDLKLEK